MVILILWIDHLFWSLRNVLLLYFYWSMRYNVDSCCRAKWFSCSYIYMYSFKNIIFWEMFYGHLLLFIGMHNLQWLLVEKLHLWKSQHLQKKKQKTNWYLIVYIPCCLTTSCKENLVTRLIWVAWLKKDAFMFQANRAFPMQLYSKLSLYQNSEPCHQFENNVLLCNSFFSHCYLVSVFMEIFTDFTHW